jgi:competence protein ComEC
MNRQTQTLAAVLLGVLVVLTGCTGISSSENQSPAPTTETKTETETDTIPTQTDDTGPSTDTTQPPSEANPPTSIAQSNSSPSEGTFEIHYINVGQGDSILVIGPTNEVMLIDTGDYTDDGEIVLDYLQRHDIERIDYLVTTHSDADHIGGHEAVITYYETQANGIGAVYIPGIASPSQTYDEFLDAVEQYNVSLYVTHTGDPIPFEGVQTEVLAPPKPYLDSEHRNENSIVLQLMFGQTSFLLPGDIEEDGEHYLVSTYGDSLHSSVLKAAHHGSATSSSGPFLNAVQPHVVVISSAYDSQYGHPAEQTLQRLAERDIDTYWTAVHGTIVMRSNGETITIATQQSATTDPLSLREEEPVAPGSDMPVEQRATITIDTDSPPPETDPTPTDDGTPTASLAVVQIHADAAGDEYDNLTDEYIVLKNTGSHAIDLSGWSVTDEAGHEYTVPSGVVLGAGETITLHTGTGTDTDEHLYWNADAPVWNNAGDTITVRSDESELIIEEEY